MKKHEIKIKLTEIENYKLKCLANEHKQGRKEFLKYLINAHFHSETNYK